MSKATQCAEFLFDAFHILNMMGDEKFEPIFATKEEIAQALLLFYPEEETTVTHYQNPAPTNSIRMIDEGRDV